MLDRCTPSFVDGQDRDEEILIAFLHRDGFPVPPDEEPHSSQFTNGRCRRLYWTLAYGKAELRPSDAKYLRDIGQKWNGISEADAAASARRIKARPPRTPAQQTP